MAATASSSPAAANALNAFMRGVERRALVLAQLQGGHVATAERVVATALHAFTSRAAQLPMPQWPVHFWALLSSTPALRQPPPEGQWEAACRHLGELAAGDRLALLLRIGAGLDEEAASQVLGVSVAEYQQALTAACPLDANGYPDAAAWRALAEAVQQQIREVDPARLAALAQPAAAAPAPSAPQEQAPARVRRRKRVGLAMPLWFKRGALIGAGVLLVAVVLWVWRGGSTAALAPQAPVPEGALPTDNPVIQEALDAAALPAAEVTPDPHASSDAAMLADPEFAIAQQADLHAWAAAGKPMPVDESQVAGGAREVASVVPETMVDDE